MSARRKSARAKLSTTVSAESYEFLKQMVKRGHVATIAEALDRSIEKVRQLENRKRLANATTRYFEQMDAKTLASENALAKEMTSAGSTIDFDNEI